jgi:alpha-beta hydrolase superfamily lysophospholipase
LKSLGNLRLFSVALLFLLSPFGLNSQTVSPYALVQAMLTGKDSLWLPKRNEAFQKAMSEELLLQTLRLFSPPNQPLTADSGECLFKGNPSLYRFHLSKTNPEQYFFLSLRMMEDSVAGVWIQPAGPKVLPQHRPAWAQSLPKPEQIWIPFEKGAFAAYLFRPENENPQKPLVYLLAGSGPQDAFSTTGPNQPLKEFAERLQWQGFIVLVHPKVSVFLPEFLSKNAKAGLQEEYAAPADAVLLWLSHSSLQNAPVFLAGHSLGGVLAPWIAMSKPQVKGVIGLAAPSTPLYFLVPKQLRFLAKKSGQWENSVARRQILDIERDMNIFHRTGQMKKSPLQGVPIAYWESVRAYAVEKNKTFSPIPHVFVGGTSDYQVPISDITGWKKWIPQANFISVKNMDHLLRISPEKMGPEAYKSYSPVDTQMVDRLAHWMLEKSEGDNR